MTYELASNYRYNQPLTNEQFDTAFGTQLDAGATSAAAWLGLTGAFTGVIAMTSRWDSLDTMHDWITAIEPLTRPGGQFYEQARANPLVSRIVSRTDVLAGDEHTNFALATRGNRRSNPEGMDSIVAQGSIDAGADGCRGSTLLLAGEWSGHVVGQFYADSAETLARLPEQMHANNQITQLAEQAQITVLSRTLFRRLATTDR